MTAATTTDKLWDAVQEETAKLTVVKEGVHLLDVCYADLRVMVKFFKDHNAELPDIYAATAALQEVLTTHSDKYETWVNTQETKIRVMTERLEGN